MKQANETYSIPLAFNIITFSFDIRVNISAHTNGF